MRTYIPEWGCFTSPDMKNDVFDTMGMGSYGFPYNNPLIYTDPSGLDGNLKRAKGHHKVVMSSLEKMDFSEAALTVLNPVGWNDGKHGDVLLKEIKSGNIKIPPSMVYTPVGHQYSTAHSIYNSKIEELANDYLKQINKNASDLNEKEAKKLLKYIEKDPYIKGFNKENLLEK